MPLTSVRAACAALALAAPLAAQTWAPRTEATAYAATAQGFASAMLVSGGDLFLSRTGGFGVGTGDIHVFRRGPNGRWTETRTFTGDGLEIGDGFGSAMAMDGAWLAIGAPNAKEGGRVHLFQKRGTGWAGVATLPSPDTARGARFGATLAFQNGLLIVSAPGRDSLRGEVYAYRRNASGRFGSPVSVAKGDTANARLGTSIALDGTRLLIGAPGPTGGGGPNARRQRGTAALYEATATGWKQTASFEPGEDSVVTFGAAVLLNGTSAVISAPGLSANEGAVYLYNRGTAGWAAGQKLVPPEAGPGQVFGLTLARYGKSLYVGAPFTGGGAGVVYVFEEQRDGWFNQQSLRGGASSSTFMQFGAGVAMIGDRLIVAGPSADFAEGTAYVFRKDGNGFWVEDASLTDVAEGYQAVTGKEMDCTSGKAAGFDCGNVDLLGFLPNSALGARRGVRLNDIWGWTDAETGKEYALVGRMDGTSFVDISDPSRPVFLGDLPMHEGAHANIWRDIKTYKNHAFIVADGAGPHGMQVFDLTRLRNVHGAPVTFTEDAHYDRIASAHNIVINEETGFAYTVGNSGGGETCGGALHMVNISDPKHPAFAGCHADPATGIQRTGYTHDAQCVTYHGPDKRYAGREICFNASETGVGIADVTDKSAPRKVAVANYPNTAYAHQGWLTEDQAYFFLDDEGDEIQGSVPKTRTLVWDVRDLEEPVLVKEFLGETSASDHNLYIKGDLMFQSNYVAGLRVVDVKNPAEPREIGYFDTVPVGDNAPGFAGSWSNYPYFKSGTIIVTSVREGLFMVRHSPAQALVP